MSSSNTNQQRDRLSTQRYQCAQCALSFYNYQQLQNHKRVHRGDCTTVAVTDQFILHDVEMQHDGNNIIDNNEFVSDSDYSMNAIEINKAISYKCGCSFEDSEGEAHIYNSSRIGSNTFTKAELISIHLSQLMLQHRISRAAYRDIVRFVNTIIRDHNEIMLEPGAKISHGKTVNALLKSKSSVKGHEYDVCPNGCQLYGINDNQESCVDCGKPRYKTDTEQSQTPAASMKLMSVGGMFSQILADSATRELLHYRANRESVASQLTDIFDGENYKQLVQQGLFSNPDDIAIGLYTNGFVNQKKGKSSYTIVHAVVFNLDPSIRYTNEYLLYLTILSGPKKSTHLDSFLMPIISEIKDLEMHSLVIKSNGVEICRAKIHLLLASGDIPAVADMAHIGSHANDTECTLKIVLLLCNLWKTSKPAILCKRNQKAHLRLDHCVPYQGDKNFYTHPDDTLSTTEYPFFIPRTSLVTIGNFITSSRPYIPVSFQGSFDNVFSKIDGTRAVDWLDFLLYIVPTLVIPFLSNRAVKTAVLSLVKGCALALQ
ncbi:C2H2-type zinc finger transcription factor [Phycomyces blakesleeanus NRRL 1555(-)]|uniref:C2H2-type zinc finger transcription factor n=1 Tax=Phycomyces blakesleeanus (strain ATCC 8743b / DSM 1359 / FGSC 10004 / NBRC 33097 / NRRL 1555) TaxID=763407 RepID=A0A167K4B7_PHYB8|nr:C2H2-type zinc finger transcription factor [Phycomyces blakesleeanus NRRL 1555(-)]OAD67250.1 C2H2-type zinc finger transcription factor [Phycomyces blakesleeanus NRRL 1555(-)]|eukprot:XP_018285290.1 C2H2-type zinc finger transcription factor [Phycomyces blakesleeanus NRRL 1555(-)]